MKYKIAMIAVVVAGFACVIGLQWVILIGVNQSLTTGNEIWINTHNSKTLECSRKPLKSSEQTLESQKTKTTSTTQTPAE